MLAEPSDEIVERICELAWAGGKDDGCGIRITEITRHNAANQTYVGTVDYDGHRYGFVIDNGDWAGTVVQEWGTEDVAQAYRAPEPSLAVFVPSNPFLSIEAPAKFDLYCMWRTENWLKELERSYNYDRHFSPGLVTENHYRAAAAKRGLVPGSLSNFSDAELEILRRHDPHIEARK